MNFTMYTNTSDNRYIDKSITQIGNAPVSCVFKENTSIENPTIILSPTAYDASCNYGYISDTGRYYYVVDVEYSQQRILLHLKVDVLMSFASGIKNSQCNAQRSSSKYNKYFMDEEITSLNYTESYVKNFPNSLDKALKYVLVIAG